MQAIIDFVSHLRVGEPKAHLNLTVFPILNGGGTPPDYLTLDEAIARKTASITEVSTGGSVPELRFVNSGDRRIFLLDGEELVGAKQNRVLNLSIMVPPGITIVIPVSCVERGRWSYRSAEFRPSPRTHHAEGRAKRVEQVTRSMMAEGIRVSDQGQVWHDIDMKFQKLGHHSPTSAMAEMYESAAASLEEFVCLAETAAGQTGAIFAVDGFLVGFDLFDSPETLRRLLPKLVRSYALDALGELRTRPKQKGGFPVPPKADAEAFLGSVAEAKTSAFPGTGEGEDVRLSGGTLNGAALVVDGRVIHLGVFRAPGASPGGVM